MGIVGYGSISRERGRLADQMGLRVLAMKRDPTRRRDEGFIAWPGTGDPEGKIPAKWFTPDRVGDMLAETDVLMITCPRTAATTGMSGYSDLTRMHSRSYVLVISRGASSRKEHCAVPGMKAPSRPRPWTVTPASR